MGDVLLIPTIESGLSLWKKNGFQGTFVTREGDIISPQGVLSGGSGAAVEKSLLSTKREIAELESEIAALNSDLECGNEPRDKIALVLAQWEEEIGQIKVGIQFELEIDINSRKKD